MRVLAQRGGPDMLLVETRTDSEGNALGRIYHVRRREMGPEQMVEAIAKFGYWEPTRATLGDLSGVRYMESGRGR